MRSSSYSFPSFSSAARLTGFAALGDGSNSVRGNNIFSFSFVLCRLFLPFRLHLDRAAHLKLVTNQCRAGRSGDSNTRINMRNTLTDVFFMSLSPRARHASTFVPAARRPGRGEHAEHIGYYDVVFHRVISEFGVCFGCVSRVVFIFGRP